MNNQLMANGNIAFGQVYAKAYSVPTIGGTLYVGKATAQSPHGWGSTDYFIGNVTAFTDDGTAITVFAAGNHSGAPAVQTAVFNYKNNTVSLSGEYNVPAETYAGNIGAWHAGP